MINLYNADCLSAMLEMADNQFDLAIVDPPYGINAGLRRSDTGKNKHIKQKDYHYGDWDKSIPSKQYFDQLKRVSKNQIIWGGNYFLDYLSNTKSMIVWDKKNGDNLYADAEIAWTSFDMAVRLFAYKWHGFLQENMRHKELRIHPTQKPVALYTWILHKYAKEGDSILDTHLGSGSIAIACHDMGFDLTAYEIDEEYFAAASNRLKQHQRQLKLF
jgi:site-specific DNA-methyltransferase (adenine-specific)